MLLAIYTLVRLNLALEAVEISEVLFSIENIKKYFPVTGGILGRVVTWVRAVDDVSFKIYEGESLGLVGESGCGKTTLGRCILYLTEPTSGKIIYKKKDIGTFGKDDFKNYRRQTAMIFQDPFLSLHPRMTIGETIGEPYVIHGAADGKEREKHVTDWIRTVGLNPYHIYRYPHEFSGGQKQRIGIARAMALNPGFIVADEPVAALDVSVRASIINLMRDLQKKFHVTYLFISHDIAIVRQICNRIVVMYLGKAVESAEVPELFDKPLHPYTQALLSAVPIPDPEVKRTRIILKGDVPSPINPPSGCRFHPRCPSAKTICSKEEPEMLVVGKNHMVACHHY